MMALALALWVLGAEPEAARTDTGESVCLQKQELEVLTALRQRRLELDQREAVLKAREVSMDKLRKQVDDKIGQMSVEVARLELKLQIGEAYRQDRERRLTMLVESLGGLSAKKAAPVLAAADPALVSEVMMRLGPDRTAALLAVMKPVQAGGLVNQLGQGDKRPTFGKPPAAPAVPAVPAATGGKS